MSPADVHHAAQLAPVPPEKPLSLFRFMTTAKDNIVAGIPAAAYREPVYPLEHSFGRMVIVSDPASIKRVLLDGAANYPKARLSSKIISAAFGDGILTSDGEKWRKHRRIMAPSFDFKAIAGYAPAMVETTTGFIERWDRMAPGAAIDIDPEMTDLTLRIISRTMFSSDSDGICRLVGDTLHQGMDAMTFGFMEILPVVGPWRMNRKMEYMHSVFSALDASIEKLIDARAGAGDKDGRMDLLGRLVAARDVESGSGMTTREVRDEVVIIFIAGHETTAVAMMFTWYLLSQHPAVEAKLHKELDEVLQGRPPRYEDLEHLPYTRQVIQESMRIYPPVPSLTEREAAADDEMCGVPVKKGAQVAIMPWVLHRHQTLWSDPGRFDPERFSPQNSAGRDRFAWLPFGGGPRICIGAALAMTEASLILATIAQRFRLRLVEGQRIQLKSRITLRPRNGIKLTVERRKRS